MIYGIFYLAALLLAGTDLRGRLASWRIVAPQLSGGAYGAILVTTYAVQLAILYASANRGWAVPLVPPQPVHVDAVAVAMLALAIVQVVALAGLYRARIGAGVIVAGATMLLLSLLAPFFCNADVYAYVGNGFLAAAAYVPPATPFPGDLAAINMRWGTPVPAATYGPLWLAIAHALVTLAPTLTAKLFAFRALGFAAFAATLGLLRLYGLPPRTVALAALNPGLLLQFVVDAHNDALPIALCVAAAVCVRRLPVVACALIVAAASIKLPYALAGLPVLAAIAPPARRVVACVGTVLATLLVAWLWGGIAYARALVLYATGTGALGVLHGVAALAAVAALLAAVAGARRYRAAVWLVPMLGAYTASWYAIWGLPYALARRRIFNYLMLWFPIVSIVAEPSLATPWGLFFVVPALVALGLLP